MAVISFCDKPEGKWGVAGWVMRQMFDDVLAQFPNDSEMRKLFEVADLMSGFGMGELSPLLANRIIHALSQVAKGVLEGTIRSGILDRPEIEPETVQQYREVLRDLLEAIAAGAGSL